MKAIQNLAKRSLLLVALLVIGCLQLMAQTRTVKGEVTDAQNGEKKITLLNEDKSKVLTYLYSPNEDGSNLLGSRMM